MRWPRVSPHNLSGQIPWQKVQTGVYDGRWGTDTIRVVVAGELPREPSDTRRCTCSAPRRNWWNSGAVPTSSARPTPAPWNAVRATSRGGVCHVVYDGGLPAPVRRRRLSNDLTPAERREALESLPPNQRPGSAAISAAGGTLGSPLRRANPGVPGAGSQRAPDCLLQAAAAEVSGTEPQSGCLGDPCRPIRDSRPPPMTSIRGLKSDLAGGC